MPAESRVEVEVGRMVDQLPQARTLIEMQATAHLGGRHPRHRLPEVAQVQE